MNRLEVGKRAAQLVRESGARCNCYWDNGDHADSCDLAQEWDRCYSLAQDEAYDKEQS